MNTLKTKISGNTLRRALATFAVAGLAVTAAAVPAKRGFFTVTQPDGTEISITRVGDETMHFTLTADSVLVTCAPDGFYNYARVATDGKIIDTGIHALDVVRRPVSHNSLVTPFAAVDLERVARRRTGGELAHVLWAKELQAELAGSTKIKRQARRNTMHRVTVNADGTVSDYPQKGLGRFTSNFPTRGKIKGLVILAEYTDLKFQESYTDGAHAYFESLLNEPGFSQYGGTGCVTEYFQEMSMGQFDPEFVLVGPVSLPNNCAYYGGNDANGDDRRAVNMIADACRAADELVDFSEFDNDGDGTVDNVFVFYAGEGEASGGAANTIWPHSWELAYGNIHLTLDGVRISRYACSNEWQGMRPDGVGTFIHEFSHVMGLPDLYSTQSAYATHTPGSYSALDYGPYNNDGRTPPAYSAYERNAMGWLQPFLLDGQATITLDNIVETNQACLAATDKDSEFFLFENRQLSGWDKYLPGHGMLIWHIDYVTSVYDNNTVNNRSSHSYVDIVEACGRANSGSPSTMAGYTWPGAQGKTKFTDTTTPAFKSWSGKGIDLPITDIEEADGLIHFNVGGGTLSTPVAVEPTQTGADWFTAAWEPVAGATDYLLTVRAIRGSVEPTTETATFDKGDDNLATLPAGWTSSSTGVYDTASGYKNGPSSLRLDTEGQFVQTRTFDSDITGFSVWARIRGTLQATSTLTVTGLVNGEWTDLTTIAPTNTGTVEWEMADVPEGLRAVRLTINKKSGNFAIDDMAVTTGGFTDRVLPAYNGVSTAGATQMRVQDLPADATVFAYTVIATDGISRSKPSQSIKVDLSDTGGVDDITADSATADTVTANGRTLTVTTAADRVRVYDAQGALIANVRVSDGEAVITVPTAGFYIVKTDNGAVKVALH